MNTWKEECVYLLKNLGGHAYLKDIYREYEINGTKKNASNWQASIRNALEKGSKESLAFDGEPLFYMVEGKNKGHYALLDTSKIVALDETQDDDDFVEGKKLLKLHLTRERNYQLITNAKKRFKDKYGKLFCEVCGFNFVDIYGEIGEDFIEGHHIKPISEMTEDEKTNIDDIVMLCSNCHSMIHRKKPWLKKEDLKKLIRPKKN